MRFFLNNSLQRRRNLKRCGLIGFEMTQEKEGSHKTGAHAVRRCKPVCERSRKPHYFPSIVAETTKEAA